MDVFNIALNQLIVLFLFIITGYIFRKKDILPPDSTESLSKLEKDFLMPALVFETFSNKFNWHTITSKFSIICWGLIVAIFCVFLSYPLSERFSKDAYEKRIYRYSLAIPNIGFMGYPLVQSVFGQEVLFDYMIFVIPINFMVYTWGIIQIIPDQNGGKNKTNFINSVNIAMMLGIIVGLLKIPVPYPFKTAISSASACLAPLAMLLTGMTIGKYNVKALLKNDKVFYVSMLRLVVIPSVVVILLKMLKVNDSVQLLALCMASMPLGLNTIIFPASYGKDTSLGASMAMVSHTLSILTIPVMLKLFS